MPCRSVIRAPWPARDRRPVGRLRDLEVIDAGDVLDDAVRGAVSDIHVEGEVGRGLHRGQIRLDWPAPLSFLSLSLCDLWEEMWIQLTTEQIAQQYQCTLADALASAY